MSKSQHRILIAERNPHVRGFLGRELVGQNFLVTGAHNSDEVLKVLHSASPPDLVIVATDTPNTGNAGLLEQIAEVCPGLPVILHVYNDEVGDTKAVSLASAVVEKNANPEHLTRAVFSLLHCENTGHSQTNRGN